MGKTTTQTQNTMKLQQNSIEMITTLRNHPCPKQWAGLNQPLRNQDTTFSKANLLLTFCSSTGFANGFCVFLRLCSCVWWIVSCVRVAFLQIFLWKSEPTFNSCALGRVSTSILCLRWLKVEHEHNQFRVPWIELQFLRAYWQCRMPI